MSLRPATKSVAHLLADWQPVHVDLRDVASELGISYRTVRLALQQLSEVGALERTHSSTSTGLRDVLPLEHPIWDEVAR